MREQKREREKKRDGGAQARGKENTVGAAVCIN
jgi:hypothetical protein